MASTLLAWAFVSDSPNRSASARAAWIPAAPSLNSGSSWAPARPKIRTAAAARSASVGSSEIAWAIASNCCSAERPLSSATDRPIRSKAAMADCEPLAALANATWARVIAPPICSIDTPTIDPASVRPESSA